MASMRVHPYKSKLPAHSPPIDRMNTPRFDGFDSARQLALLLCILLLDLALPPLATAATPLESGWHNPPRDARLRAYWWWLNGNVTREAITRDLEEMKAKGFGGALICDADGSSQDGNDRAPRGPTFLSPEWRELYRHALREADRLGLEMSLNIQSGWNLGGPMVTPDDAPKKLVWTETRVTGGTNLTLTLARPRSRDNYYRDLFVLAWPVEQRRKAVSTPAVFVTASSAQFGYPADQAADGLPETFWVSVNTVPGKGPTKHKPEWIQLRFAEPVRANRLWIAPRPGYGPRQCALQVSEDGYLFRPVKSFAVPERDGVWVDFPETRARVFRVLCHEAYDPLHPETPRNVQIAELRLAGPDGEWPRLDVHARPPLQNWLEKALHKPLVPFSAPETAPLFQEHPATPHDADTRIAEVLDLSRHLDTNGVLRWPAPSGEWQVLRLGCTLNDHCRVSTCSQGWEGYALDPFDAGAFRRYWDAVVEPLIAYAGPRAGTTLKYLHTDSWEVEVANWTPTLRDEFRQRRGYDLLPWLPVLAGKIVNSRDQSNRFLHDFRRTFGDLAIDNHYRLFRDGAHKHGLLIHPESGGPHAVPIDAQQCLGFNDAPMSEFWAWSWRHRVGDANRFFVKQPASAAHTYGRKLVLAEGFTTIGPHWQETLWDNLKPSFDKALCEGLNLLVWHAFVCSPAGEGIPGQQYFAGTHLNPLVTWWEKSGPFFDYINRCQFLLQQGRFVADVAFYYGNHVPNFARLKNSDPANILPGYDYDVVTTEVLLTRMKAESGRLVLPDGMSYRVLVLRDLGVIPLPVLRKLKEFVAAGIPVVGARPTSPGTLENFPACDAEFAALVRELWGEEKPALRNPKSETTPGRVITGRTAREVLLAAGVPPDFEWSTPAGQPAGVDVDFIHRRDGDADIYFVANRSTNAVTVDCTFRVAGKAPELWDAVSGERRFAAAYTQTGGRTTVPLDFVPCGSWFVIFREPAAQHPATAASNGRRFVTALELTGPWTVRFDPHWGGPESAGFSALISWTEHTDPGIRFYSGTATYTKTFEWQPDGPNPEAEVWLDLGDLRELADIRLNGKPCGIVWTPPFRVKVTGALRAGGNTLEVDVVNFWPNRLIGDAALPPEQRRTRTNIRKLTADTPLMRSGLFGPVRLQIQTP